MAATKAAPSKSAETIAHRPMYLLRTGICICGWRVDWQIRESGSQGYVSYLLSKHIESGFV